MSETHDMKSATKNRGKKTRENRYQELQIKYQIEQNWKVLIHHSKLLQLPTEAIRNPMMQKPCKLQETKMLLFGKFSSPADTNRKISKNTLDTDIHPVDGF